MVVTVFFVYVLNACRHLRSSHVIIADSYQFEPIVSWVAEFYEAKRLQKNPIDRSAKTWQQGRCEDVAN